MLETIEPGVLDELMAAERLDPEPAERLIEVLKLGFTFLANTLGAEEVAPDIFEPCEERLTKEKADGEVVIDASPEQAAVLAAMILGPPPNKRGSMQWPRPSAT